MRRSIPSVGFLVVAVLAAISLGQSQVQSKPGVKNEGASAIPKNSLSKSLSDLTAQVDELKEHIRNLETEQSELRARLVQAERFQALPSDLTEADSELTRFDCTGDQNRGAAMAIAERMPSYALDGAAAMNCTQRLAKITQKAVHSLQNR